jgi:hypothetical protein
VQSASAVQSLVSAVAQAPPVSMLVWRHVSQASPLVVMLPSTQYSEAQAVAQGPFVAQSHAWMSAMRSFSPVA